MLPIKNISGETYLLTGITNVRRIRKVNGERSIQFDVTPTDSNSHSFDSVDVESIATFEGDTYIIKNIKEVSVGSKAVKQVDAIHTFFDNMINAFQYNQYTGSQTFATALNRVFAPTVYTFVIVGTFTAEEFENFGADNSLSLFQTVLDRYSAEFRVVGNTIYLYRQIGAKTGFQMRWKHNVKSIDKQLNSQNLTTYVKGFGKPKVETDVLSGTVIPYSSRSGTYYLETGLNHPATDTVGSSFRFSFTGTGFNFKTILNFLGGKWEFSIDKKETVTITTYKDITSEHVALPIIRGLEHKSHSVVATFKGKDSKNPYTKGSGAPKAIGYLKNGNIIELYRELVGDELYEVVTDYTSPNASKFPNPMSPDGFRHAEPVYDERITDKDTLIDKLKKSIQDEPLLSISVDSTEISGEVKNEGDWGYIIYEPMKIKLEARVVELSESYHFYNNKWNLLSCNVTLSNFRDKISDITTRFTQTQKRVDRMFNGQEKLPSKALDDAILTATNILINDNANFTYAPGYVLGVNTDNSSLLTKLTSQGLGISKDGGQTFDTAITGEGIVAEVITAGTLRGMHFTSENLDSLMWLEGGNIRLESIQGRYMEMSPTGLYGFNAGGSIRFQADSALVTSAALGTSNANVYLGSINETRSVHYASLPGDGLVDSYTYTPVRASGFYGNFWNINSALSGSSLYARPLTNGELRITLNGTTDQYRDLRAREINTNMISPNGLYGASRHMFVRAYSDGEVRMSSASNVEDYVNVRAKGYYGTFIDTTATHIYARPGGDPGELRVTVRGTTNVYQPVRAKDFITDTSVRDNKTNIETYEENTLDVFRKAHAYMYNRTTDKEGARKQLGMMIDEMPEETHSGAGDSFALYAFASYLAKGLKDTIHELDQLKERVESLEAV
ncbi:hypothetical protein E2R51_02375 [Jeotgalibacillus sp. S-D1]|uniref:prophage endopeptidase tail family protein n=1 Tax=Jeotgalibacillus sp. S-D1 TaxID=2552189 RepID=UPI0010595B56|nr:prophage endopeptidase tail family protein [Jeotgalibacillus sp. S-D1]TDL34583.1 hypothetical protein E2R51_02375 [Jeotgalibacillus sp. S-D1]